MIKLVRLYFAPMTLTLTEEQFDEALDQGVEDYISENWEMLIKAKLVAAGVDPSMCPSLPNLVHADVMSDERSKPRKEK